MTGDPKAARAQLRVLAQSYPFRLIQDAEGWPIIPGRLGQIDYHDGTLLAVYTDRPRLFTRLWAIPGVRRWQTGDSEMRALFPPEAILTVARVIRARRRRTGFPEAALRMRQRGLARATSAT